MNDPIIAQIEASIRAALLAFPEPLRADAIRLVDAAQALGGMKARLAVGQAVDSLASLAPATNGS